MTKPTTQTDNAEALTPETVYEYLLQHPEFFEEYPELWRHIKAPERELGDVADFQQHQIRHMQENASKLEDKYHSLIDFCRDNLSSQSRVHSAVLRLMKVHSLEQLLEVLTIDFLRLFDVDVVRLAVESELVDEHETYYAEDNYSGIAFVQPGVTDELLGGKPALLIADTKTSPYARQLAHVFSDCERQVASCALLRLRLEQVPRSVLLAFGVRYTRHFHPGQAIDLLTFLASVAAYQFDRYLQDIDYDTP